MTNKIIRILLKAVAALALTVTFGSASFAGEFTVHQGKRYRATLALNSVERLTDNALIAEDFAHWASLKCVFQVQERCVASKASGTARMPARPCLVRSLRLLDCNAACLEARRSLIGRATLLNDPGRADRSPSVIAVGLSQPGG